MAWQRVRIPLPKKLPPIVREAVAEEVIEFITKQTLKGKDKNNENFPKYNKEYAKKKGQTNVDLVKTFEMMSSINLISHKAGSILIGFDRGNKELNGKAEGNIKGNYGQPSPIPGKQRDFLGISPEELEKILKRLE